MNEEVTARLNALRAAAAEAEPHLDNPFPIRSGSKRLNAEPLPTLAEVIGMVRAMAAAQKFVAAASTTASRTERACHKASGEAYAAVLELLLLVEKREP